MFVLLKCSEVWSRPPFARVKLMISPAPERESQRFGIVREREEEGSARQRQRQGQNKIKDKKARGTSWDVLLRTPSRVLRFLCHPRLPSQHPSTPPAPRLFYAMFQRLRAARLFPFVFCHFLPGRSFLDESGYF